MSEKANYYEYCRELFCSNCGNSHNLVACANNCEEAKEAWKERKAKMSKNPTHTARVKLPRIVITEFAIDTGLARFLYKDVSIPRKAINQEGSILDLRINEQSRYVMTTPDKDGNRWEFSEELLIDIKEIEPEKKELKYENFHSSIMGILNEYGQRIRKLEERGE